MVKQDKHYGDSEITQSDNIHARTVSNGNTGHGDLYDNNKGTSGTSGSNGIVETENFKQIGSKYHFKGKYPNPH